MRALHPRHVDRVHVHVPGEPGRKLVAEPGEDVDRPSRKVGGRQRFGKVYGRERMDLRRDGDDCVASHERRHDPGHEPEERRLTRSEDGDDAGRLRHREVEVGAGDGIRAAEDLRHLVRPARVPDDTIDRGLDLLLSGGELREVRCARLHHLGQPVEHLPPVVRGHPGPGGETRARRTNRVAGILPRRSPDVLPLGLVGPAGLRPGEGASDVELVRLLDREPRHARVLHRQQVRLDEVGPAEDCSQRRSQADDQGEQQEHALEEADGRRTGDVLLCAHSNLRYGSRPCRPPSRPKPDSL